MTEMPDAGQFPPAPADVASRQFERPATQKLNSLEMLRAVAALLVVMFHVQWIFGNRTGTHPFSNLFASGFRGVDLFFVLSGFVIARAHAADLGRPRRFTNYAFNRVARIYPAVWIMTLCAAGCYAAGFGGADKADKLGAWSIAASALLLPQTGPPLVNVTWTLKYEMLFYLVFSALILNRHVGRMLLSVWLLSVLSVSVGLIPDALGLGAFFLRSLCLEFGVGLVCAWLMTRPAFVGALRAGGAQWAVLAIGAAAFAGGMSTDPQAAWAGVAFALGSGALVVGLTLLEQFRRIRIPRLLVMLGGASYAIYLVHYSSITLLASAMRRMPRVPLNNAMFLGVAIFSIVAGLGFHYLIDRPIQRLLQRTLKPMLFCGGRPAPSVLE